MLDPRTDITLAPDPQAGLVLSPEQQSASREIEWFLEQTGDPVFTVQGLAGSGKSTLLAAVARAWPDAIVTAPTGRAAAVLREKFGLEATTIHSAFYRLESESRRANGLRDLTFAPRRRAGSMTGRIVLIDEASMVTERLRADLLATGARLVAFGDPGQLPPVKAVPGFPQADLTLKQIHRQAAGSPIIRQAHRVRAGGDYQSDGPDFQVLSQNSHALLREADVMLCWTHRTRRRINQIARRAVRGSEIRTPPAVDGSFDAVSEYPRAGERVVVLRNAPRFGLWNGDTATLARDIRPDDRSVSLIKVGDSGAGGIELPLSGFVQMPGGCLDPSGLLLDFGYVLTVHKAQGSEWPCVAIEDDYPRSDPERARWIYTALTRASQRVVVIRRDSS